MPYEWDNPGRVLREKCQIITNSTRTCTAYVSIPRKREWFFILIKDCRISGVGSGSGIFKAE